MVANEKALFVMLLDRVPRFDTRWSQFFGRIQLIRYAYISWYGDFYDNNNDATTGYFTPLHMRAG